MDPGAFICAESDSVGKNRDRKRREVNRIFATDSIDNATALWSCGAVEWSSSLRLYARSIIKYAVGFPVQSTGVGNGCGFDRRIMAGLGVVEVNDANFDQEVLNSEQPVMVDFWAVWCGPCKAIAPIVDGVAAAYAGKLKVAKVNVDQNGATPSRYGIRGIPALLFFKGGKVADQIVGYVPQDVIEEKVKKLIA